MIEARSCIARASIIDGANLSCGNINFPLLKVQDQTILEVLSLFIDENYIDNAGL